MNPGQFRRTGDGWIGWPWTRTSTYARTQVARSRGSYDPESNDYPVRKEVIQPQVPLRLPCYDLVPITELTVGAVLLAVGQATSGTLSFRGLTGGVYKAQEHIHRGVADPRLLAIPASWRRIAASNPNWDRF